MTPAAPAYQDAWVQGRGVVAPGARECADRYALLCTQLQHLRPGFTVLDFGANAGYFALRLAAERGARVVAVDASPALLAARHPRVRLIPRKLDAPAVAQLERVDVVLALSVLHHNPAWGPLLTALRGRARQLLLVETPDPAEPLQHAAARTARPAIVAALDRIGHVVGYGAGFRSGHPRPVYAVPTTALRGTVFTGNGNCSKFWRPLTAKLERTLRYAPVPGSLNLRITTPLDGPVRLFLGRSSCAYWDRRRPKTGRGGGDYQFWRARFGRGDDAVSGHVMLPGVRTHGPECVELVAPLHLRDTWGLEDGETLWIRLR